MNKEIRGELQRKILQFLLHSYLYYVLDESILSDQEYDFLCKSLSEMIKRHPNANVPYIDIAKEVESSGSGFYIQEYPSAIVTSAFRTLWTHKKNQNPEFNEDFEHFIGRWGRNLEGK